MQFFEKAIENVRKDRDIKLITTEPRREYLVSEPSYLTTKFLTVCFYHVTYAFQSESTLCQASLVK